MAEEKNKKIIIASNDSDDDYSGESGDTGSEQTELSSILGKLSLGPKEKKKKLLVLSLSDVLLHRLHIKNKLKKPKNRSPDASCGPNLGNISIFISLIFIFCIS